MADIATKSTGQLFDELVTNAFKNVNAFDTCAATGEFDRRYVLLRDAIELRFSHDHGGALSSRVHAFCAALFRDRESEFVGILSAKVTEQLLACIEDLCRISLATWRAQEIVMGDGDDSEIARAARDAQRCNAARTSRIRDIDRMLGESEITITSKTYG